jgi:hypothetical protein
VTLEHAVEHRGVEGGEVLAGAVVDLDVGRDRRVAVVGELVAVGLGEDVDDEVLLARGV